MLSSDYSPGQVTVITLSASAYARARQSDYWLKFQKRCPNKNKVARLGVSTEEYKSANRSRISFWQRCSHNTSTNTSVCVALPAIETQGTKPCPGIRQQMASLTPCTRHTRCQPQDCRTDGTGGNIRCCTHHNFVYKHNTKELYITAHVTHYTPEILHHSAQSCVCLHSTTNTPKLLDVFLSCINLIPLIANIRCLQESQCSLRISSVHDRIIHYVD